MTAYGKSRGFGRSVDVGLIACAVVIALMLVGCSTAKQVADPKQDRKAMMEAAAKFYVADAAQDIEGMKAVIHDPADVLGIATATPPAAGAETSTVSWAWQDDHIVMSSPSDEATYTLISSDASPNVVVLTDSQGQSLEPLIMTKVNGVWRVDVQEIQKVAQAQADSPEGQKEACWQNQADIEGAAASYEADKGKLPKKVADLVPNYLDAVLACPTTSEPYELAAAGAVAPCRVHGHYPEEQLQ